MTPEATRLRSSGARSWSQVRVSGLLDSKAGALPTPSPMWRGHCPAARPGGRPCLGSRAQASWLSAETGDPGPVSPTDPKSCATSWPSRHLGDSRALPGMVLGLVSIHPIPKPGLHISPGFIPVRAQPLPREADFAYPVVVVMTVQIQLLPPSAPLGRDHLWGCVSSLSPSMTHTCPPPAPRMKKGGEPSGNPDFIHVTSGLPHQRG